MTQRIAFSVILVATTMLGHNALAADLTPTAMTPEAQQVQTESGWTFTFAPYFWATGLSGDLQNFGLRTIHVNTSFSEIWDHLDFGAMAIGEARYGRYSVVTDLMYSKISGSAATPRGFISGEVDSETFAGFAGVGYSLLQDSTGNLDIVGGVRVWSVDNTISITFRDRTVSRSDGDTWVDAIGGLKGTYFLTPNFFLTGWGLVGGGGADIDWDVAATAGYKFNETFSAVAGYRALGVDYSNDGFKFDVVEQGPIIGLAIKF
ncbi:hypothetical protein J2Y48_001619 [Mycoplana sp. BE70]|uniref:hypothetical protein n=1 Tax=Mycoplana sp. BE70 TaxID=2817775 RepID=UPI002864FEF7|nr:hypothetical protein [Mycoplana sp. BE70]MDR6756329.1 hypothetical protein [Mycoplana sp. BE70]